MNLTVEYLATHVFQIFYNLCEIQDFKTSVIISVCPKFYKYALFFNSETTSVIMLFSVFMSKIVS